MGEFRKVTAKISLDAAKARAETSDGRLLDVGVRLVGKGCEQACLTLVVPGRAD
jgi:hypothetical protein